MSGLHHSIQACANTCLCRNSKMMAENHWIQGTNLLSGWKDGNSREARCGLQVPWASCQKIRGKWLGEWSRESSVAQFVFKVGYWAYFLSIVCRVPKVQWHSTLVLLPGKSHGRRSLVGCSPWGREEPDTTEWLTSLSLFTFKHWRRKWQPTPVFLPGERIPGTGEPGGLPSMGSHRVGHD